MVKIRSVKNRHKKAGRYAASWVTRKPQNLSRLTGNGGVFLLTYSFIEVMTD